MPRVWFFLRTFLSNDRQSNNPKMSGTWRTHRELSWVQVGQCHLHMHILRHSDNFGWGCHVFRSISQQHSLHRPFPAHRSLHIVRQVPPIFRMHKMRHKPHPRQRAFAVQHSLITVPPRHSCHSVLPNLQRNLPRSPWMHLMQARRHFVQCSDRTVNQVPVPSQQFRPRAGLSHVPRHGHRAIRLQIVWQWLRTQGRQGQKTLRRPKQFAW